MGKDLKGKEIGKGFSQRPDGTYEGRYVDRFGKRQSLYDKNLKKLKAAVDKAIFEDKSHMNVVDENITLDEWYEKWLTIHKYKVIRANTKRHYVQVYQKHIKPTFGNQKLIKITQLQIRGLLKELDEQGYQFETKNKVRILLLDMFNKAMIDDFVLKNPAKGIKIVRDEEKDIRVLTPEEQAAFFECCKGTFYDSLFTVAVSTGLRPGELCALTWDDIDWEKMEIRVTKTLLYQKLEGDVQKTFHIGPPKTKSSIRNVPINRQCSLALKKQRMQKNVVAMKTPKKPLVGFEDLLFTTKYNTPINAEIYCDAILRIVNEINLMRDVLEEFEIFSGHCFRHTFATRCFEAGIQPKTVQQYLGHANLQMTMDLYTHVLKVYKKNEMMKLENSLDAVMDVSEEMVEDKYKSSLENQNGVDSRLIFFDGVKVV